MILKTLEEILLNSQASEKEPPFFAESPTQDWRLKRKFEALNIVQMNIKFLIILSAFTYNYMFHNCATDTFIIKNHSFIVYNK